LIAMKFGLQKHLLKKKFQAYIVWYNEVLKAMLVKHEGASEVKNKLFSKMTWLFVCL
jgi:hypothetical protein